MGKVCASATWIVYIRYFFSASIGGVRLLTVNRRSVVLSHCPETGNRKPETERLRARRFV